MQPLACRLQLCVIYMYHVCEIVHCRTVNTVILMQNANAEFEEQRGIAINTIKYPQKDINGNEQTENRASLCSWGGGLHDINSTRRIRARNRRNSSPRVGRL